MKKITVVAGVIEKKGKILCVQRGKSNYDYISGKWEFPGGKIEENESEQEALEREISEEINMKIEVKNKLMVVDHQYPDFHLTMHTYLCVSFDEPKLLEHQKYVWFEPSEFYKLDWAEADLPIVQELNG